MYFVIGNICVDANSDVKLGVYAVPNVYDASISYIHRIKAVYASNEEIISAFNKGIPIVGLGTGVNGSTRSSKLLNEQDLKSISKLDERISRQIPIVKRVSFTDIKGCSYENDSHKITALALKQLDGFIWEILMSDENRILQTRMDIRDSSWKECIWNLEVVAVNDGTILVPRIKGLATAKMLKDSKR